MSTPGMVWISTSRAHLTDESALVHKTNRQNTRSGQPESVRERRHHSTSRRLSRGQSRARSVVQGSVRRVKMSYKMKEFCRDSVSPRDCRVGGQGPANAFQIYDERYLSLLFLPACAGTPLSADLAWQVECVAGVEGHAYARMGTPSLRGSRFGVSGLWFRVQGGQSPAVRAESSIGICRRP